LQTIEIKAGNPRNNRAIAKPAVIFTGNDEVGYFRLNLIVHVLIRGAPSRPRPEIPPEIPPQDADTETKV
jgi:hypothetical protein